MKLYNLHKSFEKKKKKASILCLLHLALIPTFPTILLCVTPCWF